MCIQVICHVLYNYLTTHSNPEVSNVIPTLQVKKQKLREFKYLIHVHRARK